MANIRPRDYRCCYRNRDTCNNLLSTHNRSRSNGQTLSTLALERIASEFGSIFGKVFVAVGIIDCTLRILNCQCFASALTIRVIVCVAGGHEMAHFVNDGTLL